MDPTPPRAGRELGRAESLNLLGSVSVGRVVFTHRALPTVRPVNHVLHDGCVIVRTHPGAALLSAIGTVVAYEADLIHEGDRIGWSVIAVGYARRVGDRELTRFRTLPSPWVAGEMTEVIRIEPELVTGFALDGELLPCSPSGNEGSAPTPNESPAVPRVRASPETGTTTLGASGDSCSTAR